MTIPMGSPDYPVNVIDVNEHDGNVHRVALYWASDGPTMAGMTETQLLAAVVQLFRDANPAATVAMTRMDIAVTDTTPA
jgi:hypothetical protein